MKILKFNNNTTVQIPEEEIGISCSGGADSSLLLYILMKYHKEKIHVFTLSNNIKRRANAIIVPNVIEKCIQLTGNFNVIHHSWYSEDQTKEDFLWSRSKSFFDKDFKAQKIIVHGHTPEENIINNPHRINIDTGCYFSGKLSSVCLSDYDDSRLFINNLLK